MAKPRAPKKQNGATAVPTTTVPSAEVVTATVPQVETSAIATQTPTAQVKKAPMKPSIVKNEIRANLVPINVEEEIRRLAYLLSERRGFEPGHEAEDWLAAEREIRQRYHQQSA